ncbi:F-box protein [Parachlamydia acanthamoebae]|uniref:F-box protein n=1 Tax=Parachlamydia acanthamoebae TaxID=83552 RepID=UPI000750AC73|nr:F-box protein [Parachlamydia acanthamoebae]
MLNTAITPLHALNFFSPFDLVPDEALLSIFNQLAKIGPSSFHSTLRVSRRWQMITCDRSLKWVHLFVIPALKQVNSSQQPLHEACLEKIRIFYRSLREYTEQPSEEKSIFFLNTFLKETLKVLSEHYKEGNTLEKNIIINFLFHIHDEIKHILTEIQESFNFEEIILFIQEGLFAFLEGCQQLCLEQIPVTFAQIDNFIKNIHQHDTKEDPALYYSEKMGGSDMYALNLLGKYVPGTKQIQHQCLRFVFNALTCLKAKNYILQLEKHSLLAEAVEEMLVKKQAIFSKHLYICSSETVLSWHILLDISDEIASFAAITLQISKKNTSHLIVSFNGLSPNNRWKKFAEITSLMDNACLVNDSYSRGLEFKYALKNSAKINLSFIQEMIFSWTKSTFSTDSLKKMLVHVSKDWKYFDRLNPQIFLKTPHFNKVFLGDIHMRRKIAMLWLVGTAEKTVASHLPSYSISKQLINQATNALINDLLRGSKGAYSSIEFLCTHPKIAEKMPNVVKTLTQALQKHKEINLYIQHSLEQGKTGEAIEIAISYKNPQWLALGMAQVIENQDQQLFFDTAIKLYQKNKFSLFLPYKNKVKLPLEQTQNLDKRELHLEVLKKYDSIIKDLQDLYIKNIVNEKALLLAGHCLIGFLVKNAEKYAEMRISVMISQTFANGLANPDKQLSNQAYALLELICDHYQTFKNENKHFDAFKNAFTSLIDACEEATKDNEPLQKSIYTLKKFLN